MSEVDQPLIALVQFPDLAREVRTGSDGRFFADSVPTGVNLISILHLGYGRLDSLMTVASSDTAVHRFQLRRLRTLDSVTVVATRPTLRDFEERRRLGIGHFVTRDELAQQENRTTGDVLARILGGRVNRAKSGGAAWISSARGATNALVAPSGDDLDRLRGAAPRCYVDVYVDGAAVYAGRGSLFDVNSLSPHGIEAMEFYSGPSQIPTRYARAGNECGVLLIWTRR